MMRSLLLLAGLLLASQVQAAERGCFPYVGERMLYSVGWEFVTAGTAEVNISAIGKEGYRVHNFARTNSFFDLFRKVRDIIVSEGVCIDDRMQSTLFIADQSERSYAAKRHVEYLWQQDKVRYKKNNETTMFDVKAGHLNVLDAFYYTRQFPPTEGHPVTIPMFDSAEKYDVTVKFLKKEKIRGPDRKFIDAIVIQPELKTEGVFTSVGIIKIWLSDDERRIPLKITAKIKIGRIVVRLIEYSKA